jgi:hypothetical protein
MDVAFVWITPLPTVPMLPRLANIWAIVEQAGVIPIMGVEVQVVVVVVVVEEVVEEEVVEEGAITVTLTAIPIVGTLTVEATAVIKIETPTVGTAETGVIVAAQHHPVVDGTRPTIDVAEAIQEAPQEAAALLEVAAGITTLQHPLPRL